MKTYGKKYKRGLIIENYEDPKKEVKSKKRERQKAKKEIVKEVNNER
jgi:hypothetical protein